MGSWGDLFLLCSQPKNVGKKLKSDLGLKEHPPSVWKWCQTQGGFLSKSSNYSQTQGGFSSKSSNYSQTQVDFHQKDQIALRPRWIFIKKLKLLSDLGGFLSKSRKCGRRIIGFWFFYKKAIRNWWKSPQKFEMFRFFLLVGGKWANFPAYNECRTS